MRRHRYSRPNPLSDTTILLLLGGSVLAIGAIVLYSSPAQASNAWPASQFTLSPTQEAQSPGGQAQVGEFVILNDSTTGQSIIVQVTSTDGVSAAGTVAYAPTLASESTGDSVMFNLVDVVAVGTSISQLQSQTGIWQSL
jgi:hypothetical protein